MIAEGAEIGAKSAPTLAYASLSVKDAFPALRRMRLACFAASALLLMDFGFQAADRYGGSLYLLNQPLRQTAAQLARPLAGLLLGLAAVLWRPGEGRSATLPALLALAAAVGLLPESFHNLAGSFTSLGDLVLRDTAFLGSTLGHWALLAAIHFALMLAALQPAKFTTVRLARIAAVAMMLFAALNSWVIRDLVLVQMAGVSVAHQDFWLFVTKRRPMSGLLQFSGGLLSGCLLLIAAQRLRRLRGEFIAITASWIVATASLGVCISYYVTWLVGRGLGPVQQMFGVASVALSQYAMVVIGLVFIVPLGRSQNRDGYDKPR